MILLEQIIRIEHVGLTIVVLLETAALVLLIGSLPVIRARWRRIGRIEAEPELSRALSKSEGENDALKESLRLSERREADLAEKHAILAAWAARGPEVAERPTDRQAHVIAMRRR